MVDLSKWAKDHETYLKIADGESITCKVLGYEDFVDKENNNREKIRYMFEVDGKEKVMESQSIALAQQMGKTKSGDWIEITRKGLARQTSYTVELVKPAKQEK